MIVLTALTNFYYYVLELAVEELITQIYIFLFYKIIGNPRYFIQIQTAIEDWS